MLTRDDVRIAFGSDRGAQRSENQDDVLIYEPQDAKQFALRGRLLAVADGMGGGAGGGEASRVALRAFLAAWLDAPLSRETAEADRAAGLQKAFAAAQSALDDAVARNARLHGMGTTLTALVQCGDRVQGVHVGDSRCMHVRGGRAVWLSQVHASPVTGTQLTRALVGGQAPAALPDVFEVELQPGDRVLMMSDGLWRAVPASEGLATVHSCEPREAVAALLGRARAIDGSDNATLVLLEFFGAAEDALVGARELVETEVADVGPALATRPGTGALGRAWPWILFVLGLALGAAALWMRARGGTG